MARKSVKKRVIKRKSVSRPTTKRKVVRRSPTATKKVVRRKVTTKHKSPVKKMTVSNKHFIEGVASVGDKVIPYYWTGAHFSTTKTETKYFCNKAAAVKEAKSILRKLPYRIKSIKVY